jgi:hypothetical protein
MTGATLTTAGRNGENMMLRNKGTLTAAIAAVLLVGWSAGCESSSHNSIRTYDYGEEPRKARHATHDPTEDGADEVTIEESGEMVSPGRMVPPGSQSDEDEDDER